MTKRSAIPVSTVTKDIGESKFTRSLSGQLNTEDVIMIRAILLPEFDKKTG